MGPILWTHMPRNTPLYSGIILVAKFKLPAREHLSSERKVKYRDPVRIGWATKPDEKWQSDIMYIRIHERFIYLRAFKDEYSRYIVHPSLLNQWMLDQ